MGCIKGYFRILGEGINMPRKATEGSAGFDLQACIAQPLAIPPGGLVTVDTGIAVKLPEGTVGLVFGRSGMGIKHGITLSNSVGVIDADYTGEIKVGLCNVGGEPYTVMPFDKIAQLLVFSFLPVEFKKVEQLPQTGRGSGGFGSTGR